MAFLISTLDHRQLLDKLPIHVSDNTDSTPTMKLEDGEMNFLLSKFERIEDSVLYLQETVNKMYAAIKVRAD